MTSDAPRLVVDWTPDSARKYGRGWAVVAVDVFRATTTACTAVSEGHRCIPVGGVDEAFSAARGLADPLLAGEMHGDPIPGFHMGNSPAAVATLTAPRAIVLLSTSGTRLISAARQADACFLGCLRNVTATVKVVGDMGLSIAVIGAGTRGEKRIEDRIGCARIAAGLRSRGFRVDPDTAAEIDAWSSLPTQRCTESPSAQFLRDYGHTDDLEFVLEHDDDLPASYCLKGVEVVECPS